MKQSQIGINFPTLATIKFSQLMCEEELNRNEYKQVTSSFVDKITSYGFMDVIKVFPIIDGYYKIAEATHRYRALSSLSQGKDFDVPVAILDWKDGEDSEEVLDTIVEFNTTGKTWNIFDYVKANSNAKHHTKEVRDTFKEIFENMKRLKPRLTNAIVAGIYTGEFRGHNKIRDKKLAKKFYVTGERRIFVDTMLDRLENLVNTYGKKFVTTQFLRRLVYNLNTKANINLKDYQEWNDFFTRCITEINCIKGQNMFLPQGDADFEHWYLNIK